MNGSLSLLLLLTLTVTALPVSAAGDAAKGEKAFKKCRACHSIVSPDEVIFKGGKTGPNLFGVIGRTAGTLEGYRFGASIIQAGETGLIWDEAQLIDYIANPKLFLQDVTGDSSARSKMTFKMTNAGDITAYLVSVSPATATK